MINFIMKICVICNNEFEAKSGSQKTCSDDCRKEKDKRYSQEYRKKNFNILKEKKEIYDKNYREENKERLNKISNNYYAKNKDTKIKDYRLKNRKKILKYNRDYNNKNKDKKYYEENKGKIRERIRNYQKKNKIKVNARNYSKRHNQRKNYCEECKSKENLHFHHTNYKLNKGITLCKDCHKKRHQEKL